MFIPIVTLVIYVLYKFGPSSKITTPYHSLPEIETEDSFMHFYNYNLYDAYYTNDVGINYMNFTDNIDNEKYREILLEDIPIFMFDPIAYPF